VIVLGVSRQRGPHPRVFSLIPFHSSPRSCSSTSKSNFHRRPSLEFSCVLFPVQEVPITLSNTVAHFDALAPFLSPFATLVIWLDLFSLRFPSAETRFQSQKDGQIRKWISPLRLCALLSNPLLFFSPPPAFPFLGPRVKSSC